MITEIQVENFKSIQKLKLDLGRITVLIGENGCGKSNILEAIALASAAANNKLDNEFLFSRGIRVTEPQFMRSAFEQETLDKEIKIYLRMEDGSNFKYILQNDNQSYSSWREKHLEMLNQLNEIATDKMEVIVEWASKEFGANATDRGEDNDRKRKLALLLETISDVKEKLALLIAETSADTTGIISEWGNRDSLSSFLIYSPENSSLRIFEREGQIQPLGINGEGLFKLLKSLNSDENIDEINEIKTKLKLIDWFGDFEISQDLLSMERSIQIKDRYLDANLPYFDQKSSNEGFLFLLFYFALFISSITPDFFAVDNIDASLNPKLCSQLTRELVELSKKHDKQAILTTHNPAILDGLNLDDDEQRLFVVYRNRFGHTKAKRILKPEPLEGQKPVKLSEAFMRGYIGGLPKGF
ncbi:AAA family ATPase [Pseudanabaena sp. PCC 6802]|uniref:AAA family ATPase n=1 Tax=Pseudanabaena sp. PCC 6802 TaxID=118173 RepID=UPI0003448CBA|nr:AAA family ATPase [Pseudanabaena sp. PCC 6802]